MPLFMLEKYARKESTIQSWTGTHTVPQSGFVDMEGLSHPCIITW